MAPALAAFAERRAGTLAWRSSAVNGIPPACSPLPHRLRFHRRGTACPPTAQPSARHAPVAAAAPRPQLALGAVAAAGAALVSAGHAAGQVLHNSAALQLSVCLHPGALLPARGRRGRRRACACGQGVQRRGNIVATGEPRGSACSGCRQPGRRAQAHLGCWAAAEREQAWQAAAGQGAAAAARRVAGRAWTAEACWGPERAALRCRDSQTPTASPGPVRERRRLGSGLQRSSPAIGTKPGCAAPCPSPCQRAAARLVRHLGLLPLQLPSLAQVGALTPARGGAGDGRDRQPGRRAAWPHARAAATPREDQTGSRGGQSESPCLGLSPHQAHISHLGAFLRAGWQGGTGGCRR